MSHIEERYVEFTPISDSDKGSPDHIGNTTYLAFIGAGVVRFADIPVFRDSEGNISISIPGVSFRNEDGFIVTRYPLRAGTSASLERQVAAILQKRLSEQAK